MILKAFPIEQIIQTETLTMNNNTFTVSRQTEYSDAFHRFANSVDDKVNEYSMTPNQVDEIYNYDESTLTLKDPFAYYGALQIGESRKAYVDIDYSTIAGKTATSSATTNLTLTFTVMDQLKLVHFIFNLMQLQELKK